MCGMRCLRGDAARPRNDLSAVNSIECPIVFSARHRVCRNSVSHGPPMCPKFPTKTLTLRRRSQEVREKITDFQVPGKDQRKTVRRVAENITLPASPQRKGAVCVFPRPLAQSSHRVVCRPHPSITCQDAQHAARAPWRVKERCAEVNSFWVDWRFPEHGLPRRRRVASGISGPCAGSPAATARSV